MSLALVDTLLLLLSRHYASTNAALTTDTFDHAFPKLAAAHTRPHICPYLPSFLSRLTLTMLALHHT